jgi:hypothetical protein
MARRLLAIALLMLVAVPLAQAEDAPPRLPRKYWLAPAAGIALTALAGALSIAGIAVAAAPHHCTDPENWCGIGAIPVAAGLGAGSALSAAIGAPLLVLGVRDLQREKRALLVIDRIGPTGISGRF